MRQEGQVEGLARLDADPDPFGRAYVKKPAGDLGLALEGRPQIEAAGRAVHSNDQLGSPEFVRRSATKSYNSGVSTRAGGAGVADGTADRIARRRFAEDIARKHAVDPGDVEHVLSNLTLPPLERLRRSLRRARLGRPAGT